MRNSVEVTVVNGINWFNEKYIEEGQNHANLPTVTAKYFSKYRKYGYEFVNEPKTQPSRMFLRKAMKKIMGCRIAESLQLFLKK